MVEVQTLQIVGYTWQTRESAVTDAPVGQHTGDGGEDGARITSPHGIGRQEGWYKCFSGIRFLYAILELG